MSFTPLLRPLFEHPEIRLINRATIYLSTRREAVIFYLDNTNLTDIMDKGGKILVFHVTSSFSKTNPSEVLVLSDVHVRPSSNLMFRNI